MATRAIYHFRDDQDKETYRVYKHWDNYPSGAYECITKALEHAWPLPRFEANEFACAFIAGNKEGGGGLRLVPHGVTDMGQDYDYYISCSGNLFAPLSELIIQFEDCDENGEPVHFKGTLKEMKEYIDKVEKE